MQSTHFPSLIGILLLFLCTGCGEPKVPVEDNTPPPGMGEARPTSPSGEGLSPAVLTSGTSGNSPETQTNSPLTTLSNDQDRLTSSKVTAEARSVLNAMIAAYRKANVYSDQAVVKLSYTRDGQQHVDEAPLTVAFERDSALRMKAYAADIAIINGRLTAAVSDPASGNMDGQLIDRRLSRLRFTPADVYFDPALTHFATAGLGGPSPQLELLMTDDPLAGLFQQNATVNISGVGAIESFQCSIVSVETQSLTYRFWIDNRSALLRRIELPLGATGLASDPAVSSPQLSIELRNAEFSIADPQVFNPIDRPLPKRVTYFVPPPPTLINPHLGQRLPSFEFVTTDGNKITNIDPQQRWTVMLWIANHSASQMAANELLQLANQRFKAGKNETQFILVMAEPDANAPQSTEQLLQSWNNNLPVANDMKAIGRDIFHVSEAPTMAVYAGDGELEWFQPRVAPDFREGLAALLSDLEKGVRIGRQLRDQYQLDQNTYRKLLSEAAPTTIETLPHAN